MASADVATVVAQLLAFSKDPVRHRNRLTHGREILEGGVEVFRLAQGRFPQGLLREFPAAERQRIRAAAVAFIRQVCFWEGASHYQVLCVSPDAPVGRIKEHYQAMIGLIHPDRQDEQSPHWPADAASRVNHAYEFLSNEARRREYDAGLRKSLRVSAPAGEPVVEAENVAPLPTGPIKGLALHWRRARRHVLPVLLVISGMFYVQMWWLVANLDHEQRPQSSASLEQVYRWTQDVFSSGTAPRFMQEGKTSRAPHGEEKHDNAEPPGFFSRLLSGTMTPEPATPSPRKPLPARAGAMPPADLAVTPVAPRSPAKAIEPAGRGKAGANDKTGGRVAAEKAGVPAEVAKSTQPQSVTGGSTSATAVAMSSRQQDLESLLLRFMIFYEAGDLKNLLRLIDTDRLGVMQKFLLQANFENFFRDTQSRSLSIEWVRWENMLESRFRMSGQARLRAQYADDGRVVDRAVPMEITVESGPEGLKITRLSVFPND